MARKKKQKLKPEVFVIIILCAILLGAATYFGGNGTARYVANAPCVDANGMPCSPLMGSADIAQVKGASGITMDGVGKSDQNGDVQLISEAGSTRVEILLAGLSEGTVQNLSIQAGSCDSLKETLYSLNNAIHSLKSWGVVLGESSTILPVSKDSLLALSQFAIVARASASAESVVVSCGDYQAL